MKSLLYWTFAAIVAFGEVSLAQSAEKKNRPSDREKLIGAWHLAALGEAGPDGKVNTLAGLKRKG